MSHTHLTLEERIVIEVFVQMGMTCREIATYLGRSHTTVSRELRRNSSKSGYRAQTANRRAQTRRKIPRHYRCLNQPQLIAYVDESCTTTGLPNRLQGAFDSTIQRMRPCVAARKPSIVGSMPRHSLAIPAIVIYAAPIDDADGKPGTAEAGVFSRAY